MERLMEGNMKVALVMVISLSMLLITPALGIISLDLESATKASYSNFLTTLRNELKDNSQVYSGIPMMPPPPNPPTYLLVQLIATQDISITIALKRSDVYLIAYCDQYDGKPRAHFFSDAPSNAQTTLFKEAESPLRITINYKSTYGEIRSKSGDNRKVGLGLNKMRNFMEQVYGEPINDVTEAKFLLVAIQMVSEAVRFKYIENQVLANFEAGGFTPDYKILNLEVEWSKISRAIKDSKDGILEEPLKLKDARDKTWIVTKVEEIAPDMALLSYAGKKKLTIATTLIES